MKTKKATKRTHFLLVGGTRGIGLALTRTLAEKGHHLSIIGRRPPQAIDKTFPMVRHWSTDVTDSDGMLATLAEIIREKGQLTHLVFLQRYRGKGEDWVGEMEISLTATRLAIEFLAAHFDGAPENSIVLVGSIAGCFVAAEQSVGYHVVKAGIVQMARYYAVTLGPQGIRVNCVSPGTVLKNESKEFYLANRALLQHYKDITPLGRMGTAEEVADVIAFLCSSESSFLTGQNIVVDGGLSLQSQDTLSRRVAGLQHPNLKHEKKGTNS